MTSPSPQPLPVSETDCCHVHPMTCDTVSEQSLWDKLGISYTGISKSGVISLGIAGVFYALGFYIGTLHSAGGFTDWKTYARPILGVIAVNKLNDAFGLKLPPWLLAIETVGVITPMISGFTLEALQQFLMVAPVVALSVLIVSWLDEPLTLLFQKIFIPPWITRFGLSMAMLVLNVNLFKGLGFGATAAMQVCPRGCSVGTGGICISQVMEALGSLFNGLKGRLYSKRN